MTAAVTAEVEHTESNLVSSRLSAKWLRTPAFLTLLLLVVVALIGPFFVRDPLELGAGPQLASPSSDFWLGQTSSAWTSSPVWCTPPGSTSLSVSLQRRWRSSSECRSVLLAALRGGLFDSSVLRVSESLQAFPTLLLALGIVAGSGRAFPISSS